MHNESEIEIYKQHRASQDKYIYFLLAAAGAGIGFALNQTKGAALSLYQYPLAFAVLSWGISFYAGCKNSSYINGILLTNAELLRALQGKHPLPKTPEEAAALPIVIREAIKKDEKIIIQYASIQFKALITGALLYIAWHIIDMWQHTI
ncbi:MAG: hypothetical protein AABY53_01120 [Bdellovibrionota bacterium]